MWANFTFYTSRIPYKVILAWTVLVLIGYYLRLPSSFTSNHPYASFSYQTQTALLSANVKHYLPQAVVFIAMGNLATESLVEDSISAVRLIGHWTEHIYILTDRTACFEELASHSPFTEVIFVPSKTSIMEIKTMKAEIFHYLPKSIDRVLYLDVDIFITRNIAFFFNDLGQLLFYHHTRLQHQALLTSSNSSHPSSHSGVDFAAFLDAGGHYVGWCAGCEKWHTGVLYLTRTSHTTSTTSSTTLPSIPKDASLTTTSTTSSSPSGTSSSTSSSTRHSADRQSSSTCMKDWASILTSNTFTTDQESLDFVERNGSCPLAVTLPSRHLLFAKDYLGMIFTSGQTFIHLTSVNRAEGKKDWFYREVVVPRLRNALHPPLRPYQAAGRRVKQC